MAMLVLHGAWFGCRAYNCWCFSSIRAIYKSRCRDKLVQKPNGVEEATIRPCNRDSKSRSECSKSKGWGGEQSGRCIGKRGCQAESRDCALKTTKPRH